jgi:hypothetical protein
LHPPKHRNDLLTVPSCPEHNQAKSNDDEYLLCILSGLKGTNPAGTKHGLNWFSRSEAKRPGRALSHWSSVSPLTHFASSDPDLGIMLANVDSDRIASSLELIAKGLYFLVYDDVVSGEVQVMFEWPHNGNTRGLSRETRLIKQAEYILNKSGCLFSGPNPKVFWFRAHRHFLNGQECVIFELVFYGKHRAFAVMYSACGE